MEAIARVHVVHAINTARCQVATNLWTKPTDLSHRPRLLVASKLYSPSPIIIFYQTESWYSFYRPTEGRRLSQPRWLVSAFKTALKTFVFRWLFVHPVAYTLCPCNRFLLWHVRNCQHYYYYYYISRWFTCLRAVTHPSSNRAQCRLITLIKANI